MHTIQSLLYDNKYIEKIKNLKAKRITLLAFLFNKTQDKTGWIIRGIFLNSTKT